MFPRLEALRRQFTEAQDGAQKIAADAATAGRDLTADEQANIDTLLVRCEELGKEIEPLAKQQKSIDATANVLAGLGGTRTAPAFIGRAAGEPVTLTAGEYLSAFYRSTQGDTDAGQLLTRAVAGQTTTDNGGVIPVPIIGELIKLADDSRPVFGSFTARPMPAQGKSFTRPRVTQRVLVGEQAAELDEVSSQKMTITGDSVTKRTFAGVLELSEQDLDWTDPAMLDIVLADFLGVYASVTEAAACTALTTLGGTYSALWAATDIGDVVASVLAGVAEVYDNAKRMPDTMWWSLDQMLAVAALTDANNSTTAFTVLNRALADAGVNLAHRVGPGLAATTRIIGCSSLVESYEQQKGFISAANVSHLGADIAYRGYVAFHGQAKGFAALEAA